MDYEVRTSSLTLAQIAAKYGLSKGNGSLISKWVKNILPTFRLWKNYNRAPAMQVLSQSAKNTKEGTLQKQLEDTKAYNHLPENYG